MQAPNSLQLFEANRWLERTGIEVQVVDMQPLPHGYAHRNDLLTIQEGEQIVLRRYQHRASIPARKERGFYGLLRHQAGVPAPRVLGILSTDDAAALVMEYIHGQLLGDLAPDMSDGPCEEVHRTVGQALHKIHSIQYRQGGLLVGEDLVPFSDGSWGAYILADVKKNLQPLVDQKLLTRQTSAAVLDRFTKSLPMLNSHVPTLVHGDFHPWNLLVAKDEHAWTLRAVLDIEAALVGDPQYDLARFLTIRLGPYPEVPQSFFDACGLHPDPPRQELYTMAMMLSAARAKNAHVAMSSYLGERALGYVAALPKLLGL